MKFVPLPCLKNAGHRKASSWLIDNSEKGYTDTIILACEADVNGKKLGFNAHLNALTVSKTWQNLKYNYYIRSAFKMKISHNDSILSNTGSSWIMNKFEAHSYISQRIFKV